MATKLNQLLFITKTALITSTLVSLTSCSSISFSNPFGSGNKGLSGMPENAIAYECEGNKRFYVRMQNNGNDAWLIYPDHEVNLTKASDNNNKFTSGVITLLLNGDEATLNDGEKIAYTACKPQKKN
jgi:membrane-bound inhibitor of C-type lysozyme